MHHSEANNPKIFWGGAHPSPNPTPLGTLILEVDLPPNECPGTASETSSHSPCIWGNVIRLYVARKTANTTTDMPMDCKEESHLNIKQFHE